MTEQSKIYGPRTRFAQEIHRDKYQSPGEGFLAAVYRQASALSDSDEHFVALKDIYREQRFLNAGRIQSAMGAPRQTTPYNCFVSMTIPDSMDGILQAQSEAVKTMRLGGGIGYDFSTLRPRDAIISTLSSTSCGPVKFMDLFDAGCSVIMSAGHRRGAQMGVLRVDHPDIEEFILVKRNPKKLNNFNISVGITDEFMSAVKTDSMFNLVWNGVVHKQVRATYLWDLILRSTWDWAEPGVLFIDTINKKNNLYYIEKISATNPCGEQPLPPYGACLLGSFNLTKYVCPNGADLGKGFEFDWEQFKKDTPHVVRALDNVIDRAIYPLPEQEVEAKSKRRMGIGITGLANTAEILGFKYGTAAFLSFTKEVMSHLQHNVYTASIDLAEEKGVFPLFNNEYLDSAYIKRLPQPLIDRIAKVGIRNSHLLSIAPTGTISISADNISSGIEPPFRLEFERSYNAADGMRKEIVQDYAYAFYGIKGRTADEIPVSEHVAVLNLCSYFVDSACSKTCNVGSDVTWAEFKQVYMDAYDGGSSGCTTFRSAGKREGILKALPDVPDQEGAACFINSETGMRECE
jgi:ribonucleoside-diphosphate reductase alpha chain